MYAGTEEGLVLLFRPVANEGGAPFAEIEMPGSIYPAPVYANGELYVTTRSTLYVIQEKQTDG